MKKFLFGAVLSLCGLVGLSEGAKAQTGDQYFWSGEASWRATVVCLDTPTNARLNPNFNNNVRATLVGDTCGNPLYYNNGFGEVVHENGFYLVEFWFDELGEWRRYWIYKNQIDNWYF